METIKILCDKDVAFRRAFVGMLIEERDGLNEQINTAMKNFVISEDKMFRDQYLRLVGAATQLQKMIDNFDEGHRISEGVKQ